MILTWTAVLAVTVFSVLVIFLWFWMRSRMERQPLAAEGHAAVLVKKHKASEFESPTEQAALDLVKQALALRDAAKVEQCFRPGSGGPEAVIAFLTGMKERDGEVIGYRWLSSMDANGLLIDGVLVISSKDGARCSRLALLTPDETGVWKIDFDAFARTVEPSWEELLAEGGGQGLVRVAVAPDNYYNGPFKNEAQWVCYSLVTLDNEMLLLGYCRRGSPQELAMQRILSNQKGGAGGLLRATLELRRPEAAESRQFEITRVLAEDWVLAAKPFEAAFE